MAWLLAVFITVAIAYAVTLLRQHRRTSAEPPVVFSAIPFVGSAVAFGSSAIDFVRACRARHGDVFTAIFLGKRVTFVCDDTAAKRAASRSRELSFALVGNDVLKKGFELDVLAVNGYETVDAELHRQYADFLLRDGALADLAARATTEARLAIDRYVVAERFGEDTSVEAELYGVVSQLVFETTVAAMFGSSFRDADPGLRTQFEAFDAAFPLLVGGAPHGRGSAARRTIERRFAGAYLGADASPYLQARAATFRKAREAAASSTGQRKAAEKLETASQTAMLWAVLANTMPAAFWAIFYALRELKKGDDRVLRDALFRDDGNGSSSSSSDDVIDAVVTEALRLSSGSLTLREATAPTSVATTEQTFAVRHGDRVAIFPPLRHLDPSTFADPDAFDYRRHLTPNDGTPSHVQPFGAGVSMCPGRRFARGEIAIFLRAFLGTFDVDLDEKHHPGFRPGRAGLGVYPPAAPVPVRLALRRR